jgi:hypothetical protein
MEDAPVQIGASFRMPSIFLNEDQSKIEERLWIGASLRISSILNENKEILNGFRMKLVTLSLLRFELPRHLLS